MLIAWAAAGVFAAAAMRDLVSRCIDDWCVLGPMALWCAWAAVGGMPWAAVLAHLGVALVAFVAMWGAFAMGKMGGGDVKLSAAVFLWAGPDNALGVLVIILACGIVLGFVCLAATFLARFSLPRPVNAVAGALTHHRGVPYGIALSAGGALAALASTVSGG